MKKFVSAATFLAALLMANAGFAAEEGVASTSNGLAIFGIMIGLAFAIFGGAAGQGKAAATALEGIARNPEAANKIQTPMIIGLALIESLVLYGLIVAIMLIAKL